MTDQKAAIVTGGCWDDQSMSPPNVETSQPESPVEEEPKQDPGDHESEGERMIESTKNTLNELPPYLSTIKKRPLLYERPNAQGSHHSWKHQTWP